MEWLIAAQGMKLIFVVWNWMRTLVGSLKNTLKKWKKYTDMDGNPGRNLVDFFIPEVCHDCERGIPMID